MRPVLFVFSILTCFGFSAAHAQSPSYQTATFDDIASDCSCDVDSNAGNTPKEFIEFALSTMWIDAWETDEITKGGQLFLTGEVETENGTRDMVATLVGSGDRREVRVALGDVGTLNEADVMKALTAGASATAAAQTGVVKSKPKSKPQAKALKSQLKAVVSTKTNPFIGIKYRAPEIIKSGAYSQTIGNWTQAGSVKMAKPNDPISPRETTGNFKLSPRMSDASMIDGALKAAGLKRVNYPKAEKLDVSKELLGSRSIVAFGAARRKGKVVRFFAMAWVEKSSDTVKYSVLEAPQDEWNSWGGLATVLAYTGVRKPSEFTPEIIASVRSLSPAQETEIFETQYTNLMMALFRGTIMANMGTLNTMTTFNMATATCAGDSNCTVTADGIGGYQAETK